MQFQQKYLIQAYFCAKEAILMSKKIIDYSKTESETLNLKISRCNVDYFDEQELLKALVAESYDLCRVKVASEDEFAPLRLDKMGIPYFFSGSIRRYKTPITSQLGLKLKHEDLVFETYDGSQEELLLALLRDTWGSYPIGYYRSPILCHLLTKESEINSVFNFYKLNNLKLENSNNSILFMKKGEECVGFFALNIVGTHLESHIGGISRKHHKEGYFYDMLAYIKNFCIENNLSHFVFGARNENAQVQRIFHQAGFVPVGSENVFHVLPLLGKSFGGSKSKITIKELKNISLSIVLQNYITSKAHQ